MVMRLCLSALFVLGISFLLPEFSTKKSAAYIDAKLVAVKDATQARQRIGAKLLGEEFTESTTTVGHRDAKALSQAPDFPALLVQWLGEAGIGRGHTVAINASGSFPALTIASLAAVEAVGARPLLISSLGSSSWGANRPDYTWAHMEKELRQHWPTWRSLAMSPGGDGDTLLGMMEEGQKALWQALEQSGVPMLVPDNEALAVTLRMRLWQEHNQGQIPDLLINVGGNQAFWGINDRDTPASEGLLMPGSTAFVGEGVGWQFRQAGKPVIHLLGIKKMAVRYGVSIPPDSASPLWHTPQPSLEARGTAGLLLLLALALLPRMLRGWHNSPRGE